MSAEQDGAEDDLSPAMLRASNAIAQYAAEQLVDLTPEDALDALELTRERLLRLMQQRQKEHDARRPPR